MQTNQENNTKRTKIYCDIAFFKGNTFERNIKSINNLLFGQGIKISNLPFIYFDEKEKKNYLSAHQFIFNLSPDPIIFYLPRNFLYTIVYFDHLLFYLDSKSILYVFKFEEKTYTKYTVNKNEKENKHETTECDKIKDIVTLLEKTKQSENLDKNYEILCDVLEKYLNVTMDVKDPRYISKELKFEFSINFIKYECRIKTIRLEVDSIGRIREKLQVVEGIVSFDQGIKNLINYVMFKKEKNAKPDILVNNVFKCPIIYKNFINKEIPENQTLIIEIKSGFDILSLKHQLEERIGIIKNCLFNKDERPNFFIGIVNLDSKNVNKLEELLENKFLLKDNVLIISVIDFLYCGIDLSYEINNDYILYKKLEETKSEMNNKFTEMNNKFTEKFAEINNKIDGLNERFDLLLSNLQKAPGIGSYIKLIKELNQQKKEELNKKNDDL